MPLEQFRAILDEEGEVQEEKDAIDWILLDREGVILLQKSQPIGVPWIWSSSRLSSNRPEISGWEVLPKNGATADRDEAPCAS